MSSAALSSAPRPILDPAASTQVTALSQVSSLQPAEAGDALPLPPSLRGLLPEGALRRGRTIRIGRSTSLLLALLAEASGAGAWCAAVGIPDLGVLAAARAGIDLDRFALVPAPGASWSTATAALLDAIDVVAVAPPRGGSPQLARRLSARARERKAVLLVVADAQDTGVRWEGADAELAVVGRTWDGMGAGHGHLREGRLEVRASGRRVGGRPRTAHLQLSGEKATFVPSHGTTGTLTAEAAFSEH